MLINAAFERELVPPFDPYRDSLSYMLGSYVIPYMGLVGYVGTNPQLTGYKTKQVSFTKRFLKTTDFESKIIHRFYILFKFKYK